MSEYKDQNTEELQKLASEKRESLRVFRFEGAGSRTRNVREGRTIRKEIARILTALQSRRIAK